VQNFVVPRGVIQTRRSSLGGMVGGGGLGCVIPQNSAWIKLWLPAPFEIPGYVPDNNSLQNEPRPIICSKQYPQGI